MFPTEEKWSYFEELGHMIHWYAQAEMAVHFLFWTIVGTDPRESKLICAGMRLVDVMQILRRIIRLNKLPRETAIEVKYVLDQLAEIAKFRDYVIHRGVDDPQQIFSLISSNILTARFNEDVEVFRFRAFSDQIEAVMWGGEAAAYPAFVRKFWHSFGLNSASKAPMRSQTSSKVRSAALRSSSLSLANACSIGLRSGL